MLLPTISAENAVCVMMEGEAGRGLNPRSPGINPMLL